MKQDLQGELEVGTGWVRRPWCVWLAAGLVGVGAVINVVYLFNHCPIGLSEDEAHYWEWSRHLDYGYYSKPPGIAWVIWAAIKLGGASMAVVRMPAVLFGMLSGLLSLFLARRIFRDDRAALAVILLSAAAPMFAVGSLLITIDSPMYLCWGAAVYCLWRAVETRNAKHETRNGAAWIYLAGLACGAGMLFKPVLIAVPIGTAVGAFFDPALRRAVKTRHSLGAILVMGLSQAPVVIWNASHNWVMFRHILTQGGMGGGENKTGGGNYFVNAAGRLAEYVRAQAGGMGGVLFVLLVIAVVVAWKKVRVAEGGGEGRTRWVFLLSFAVPLWAFYFVMNAWKGTEPNWPAASYFTAMILLAGILAEGWNAGEERVRKLWRTWGTIAWVWGVLLTALAMNMQRFYPWIAEKLDAHKADGKYFSVFYHPSKWDPAMRLRGMQERADLVEGVRAKLAKETGKEPLIITNRYDTSSSLAFYMPGQPFVYCIMSNVGGRMSQYDLWPGVNELEGDWKMEATKNLAGRLKWLGYPAVIVGAYDDRAKKEVLDKAFERVEGPERLPIVVGEVVLKELVVYRAYGFKGMPSLGGGGY